MRVISCRACGTDRWEGVGPCGTCGVPAQPESRWAISGVSLMMMLREVAGGADPDMVFAEHYANSDHRSVES